MDKRKLLAARLGDAEAVYLQKEANVSWLSGFSGDSSAILLLPETAYFFTDSRYAEQAEKELDPAYQIFVGNQKEQSAQLDALLRKWQIHRLGFEAEATSVALWQEMQDRNPGLSWLGMDGEIEALRMIKDGEELAAMREGALLTEHAFQHMRGFARPGVSEADLAAELIYYFHKHGAAPSFPPIVASGENGAMPHAGVSNRKLQKGDLITVDMGCIWKGRCTDFTRTIALFGVEPEKKLIYNIVERANRETIAALRPGMTGGEADAIARKIICEAGYGECFGHGTGHGVGIEIHEAPRLSVGVKQVLLPGMVVTVEPGIYLPGKAGVRIEDMLCITENGSENFYTTDKQWVEQ